MATNAGRTPREVFQHHAQVLIAGDLEGIVSDYAEDAVFVTRAGVLRGKDGVREGFTKVLGDLPDAQWDVHTRMLDGDVLFLEWTAKARASRADDGVETFLVGDGEIVLQTVHYRHHRELAPTTELRQLQYREDARRGVGKRSRVELAPKYRRQSRLLEPKAFRSGIAFSPCARSCACARGGCAAVGGRWMRRRAA